MSDMRVMVIVKATKGSESGGLPDMERMEEMGKFNEKLADAGVMLAGEGLKPSSEGARVHFSGKSRTVTDGPFAETKELVAGFWLWKVHSMEEAIEWVKRCPNPHPEDCDIEIRPLFEAEDFGEFLTPELREQEAAVRAQTLGLEKPRFEDGRALWVAGLSAHYSRETAKGIPSHWERFAEFAGKVPGQIGTLSYGVSYNVSADCEFDYLTGVEVKDANNLPDSFSSVSIPAQRFAVFTHQGSVMEIPKTFDAIWSKWVPECELEIGEGPGFERYAADFDPATGKGMEIWVPVKR